MKTNIKNKALRISPKHETLIIKANTRNSSILTPWHLKHDQISVIKEWKSPYLMPSKYQNYSIINQIIENFSDDVTLKFKIN